MEQKVKPIVIIVLLATLLILSLVGNNNRTIVMSEEYSELLGKVNYIEIVNGTNGEKITFEHEKDIERIIQAIDKVILKVDFRQRKKVGWQYKIKCYDTKLNNWVELILRGGNLRDNKSQESPCYIIKGEQKLIELLDNYYSIDKTIIIEKKLEKREVRKIEVFSGLSGERRIYESSSDIEDIMKIVMKEELYFVDYSSDHEKGCNISLKIYSENDIIYMVYGGGTFSWLFEYPYEPVTPYYKLKYGGNLIELLEYTGL